MIFAQRICLALLLAPLISAPADAAPRQQESGSWDGRWAGAWGGSVQIVQGGRLVAYEFNGKTFPVSDSRVTPSEIVYGKEVIVTLRRTGPNTAHATIKTSQGEGSAELTRQ